MEHILFFDGVCNLCDSFVSFVVDQDKKGIIKIAPLQGATAQKIIGKEALELNSLIFYSQGKMYKRSTGVIRLLTTIGGGWIILYPLLIIPEFIRDFCYDFVAQNRYRWFGKKETCRLPTPEERSRFLE